MPFTSQMPKLIFYVGLLLLLSNPARGQGNNVALSTASHSVAAGPDGGLSVQWPFPSELSLPSGISSFIDVAIPSDNLNLIFALSFNVSDDSSPRVCSYRSDSPGGPSLVGCTAAGAFTANFFAGVSALGGTLLVTCGCILEACNFAGGITVYYYDTSTGVIAGTPSIANYQFSDLVGKFSTAVLVTPTQAYVNTHILPASGTEYRLRVVDIGTTITLVGDSHLIGTTHTPAALEEWWISPGNFPFSSALYTAPDGQAYIYSNYGSAFVALVGAVPGNSTQILSETFGTTSDKVVALTVAVCQSSAQVVFGGFDSTLNNSVIYFYELASNPLSPTLAGTYVSTTAGNITSVACVDGSTAFTLAEVSNIFSASVSGACRLGLDSRMLHVLVALLVMAAIH